MEASIDFQHYDVPDNPEGWFRTKCKHCGTKFSG